MVRNTRVMAVSLDEELSSFADKLAEAKGWSRSELYSRALAKYLKGKGK